MPSHTARRLFIAIALAGLLVPELAHARGGRAASGKRIAPRGVVDRHRGAGQAKALRLRRAKKQAAALKKPKRVVRRSAVRRKATATATAATASGTGVGPLAILQGFYGAIASPAEQLVAQITASILKYGLKVKEQNPFTGEVQTVAMSMAEEVVLGERMIAQVVPTMGVALSGRPMERYLDGIVHRLVRAAGIDQVTPYRFKVHLVHSADLNAFAAPGGSIVVTTGLLARLKSEAAIAGILAHEIGHVVARHGSQNLARGELVKDLLTSLGLAAGSNPSAQLAVLQGALELKGVMLSFSREQENQSDTLGVQIAARAGYSSLGIEEMADFLDQVDGTIDESQSDHPSPAVRRQNLFAAARQVGMSTLGERAPDRFAVNVTLPLALGLL